MTCEEAKEFLSPLCDGELIPEEAARHIGNCERCRAKVNAFSAMGIELRRLASVEKRGQLKAGSWDQVKAQSWSWIKGGETMRIPRLVFGLMLGLILLLSGGLVLVRARTAVDGPVLVLTFKLPPNGRVARCVITTDGNLKTNHCNYSTGGGSWGTLTVNARFVGKEGGGRTEIGVRTRYENQPHDTKTPSGNTDDLKDTREDILWIEPGGKQDISVAGLGQVEVTADYMDHIPTLLYRPEETLDPKPNQLRVVSPVLIRGKELVCNLAGSNSIDTGDPDATLMIYIPGDGRYLISSVPFEGAVEGNVEPGQIKFNLKGQDYLLLTAMPTTRSEHVWVTHDPQYKLSEHMQAAANGPAPSDDKPYFMVRSLRMLLQEQIHH